MIKVYDVPHGLSEIIAKYGHPGAEKLDREWYETNTDVFELPVVMRLSWNPTKETRYIRAHKDVGLAIVDAIAEIAWFYREKFEQYNRYGGVFNYRHKRGGGELSVHSWGIAIDLNPHLGRFGSQEDANTYPRAIVEIFKERGFEWGGDWANPDAMHFQACTGY
ncbi:MAG: M15 family metallopeptidase [Spirochaetia bacterium]|nr:M15 family metallopeptidase [Spirochaetia bacterium]